MKDTDNNKVRIIRAEAIDSDSLDVQLSNGNIIILETKMILGLPGFADIAEGGDILRPKTDGRTIYWRDGAVSLTLEEILSLIGRPD